MSLKPGLHKPDVRSLSHRRLPMPLSHPSAALLAPHLIQLERFAVSCHQYLTTILLPSKKQQVGRHAIPLHIMRETIPQDENEVHATMSQGQNFRVITHRNLSVLQVEAVIYRNLVMAVFNPSPFPGGCAPGSCIANQHY